MREIKFKAKTSNGEWVEGYYLKRTFGDVVVHDIYRPQGTTAIDPSTLCQFTGIKIYDLDGGFNSDGSYAKWEDVFDGDILQVTEKMQGSLRADISYPVTKVNIGDKFFVKWFESGFQLVPISKLNQKDISFSECPQISNYVFYNCKQSFEVIGNIHDK